MQSNKFLPAALLGYTMPSSNLQLHRFQVNKRVESALKKQHRWIFRRQCSTALKALPLGALVRLVGTNNQFLGLGIYEPLSLTAIRVFSFEDITPDKDFFRRK